MEYTMDTTINQAHTAIWQQQRWTSYLIVHDQEHKAEVKAEQEMTHNKTLKKKHTNKKTRSGPNWEGNRRIPRQIKRQYTTAKSSYTDKEIRGKTNRLPAKKNSRHRDTKQAAHN